MRLQKCPKPEVLFELVSIPDEMPFWERTRLRFHTRSCSGCAQKMDTLSGKLNQFFAPEPEITSSLLNVYSRLQRDETLILKGWKLNDVKSHHKAHAQEKNWSAWVFGGTAAVSVAAAGLFFLNAPLGTNEAQKEMSNASARPMSERTVPFAQLRFEDKNRIKVQYVQPELLHTIEFETTRKP